RGGLPLVGGEYQAAVAADGLAGEGDEDEGQNRKREQRRQKEPEKEHDEPDAEAAALVEVAVNLLGTAQRADHDGSPHSVQRRRGAINVIRRAASTMRSAGASSCTAIPTPVTTTAMPMNLSHFCVGSNAFAPHDGQPATGSWNGSGSPTSLAPPRISAASSS